MPPLLRLLPNGFLSAVFPPIYHTAPAPGASCFCLNQSPNCCFPLFSSPPPPLPTRSLHDRHPGAQLLPHPSVFHAGRCAGGGGGGGGATAAGSCWCCPARNRLAPLTVGRELSGVERPPHYDAPQCVPKPPLHLQCCSGCWLPGRRPPSGRGCGSLFCRGSWVGRLLGARGWQVDGGASDCAGWRLPQGAAATVSVLACL